MMTPTPFYLKALYGVVAALLLLAFLELFGLIPSIVSVPNWVLFCSMALVMYLEYRHVHRVAALARKNDGNVCPKCQYPMTLEVDAVCPECGTRMTADILEKWAKWWRRT